ncbi:MAG: hypothetical protein DRN49_01850 [Thaumarchaeota archaeon]|nr:MAG: hypothetical protein DRN49_01850 [Nitrososphaerota archaeon]
MLISYKILKAWIKYLQKKEMNMNEYGDLDIPLVIDKVGSRLRGLVIRNLENMPGQGAKIFSILQKYDFNVLSYLASSVAREGVNIYICVEIPEKELEYDRVAKELKSATEADEVVWEDYPIPGFSHQPFFPITCFSRRGVFFIGYVLKGLFEGVRKRLGASVAKILFYHMGRMGGLNRAAEAKKERSDLTVKQLLLRFLLTGYAFGQYIGELVEWSEEGRIVIRTKRNWESELLGKGYNEPQCHFTRGFLEGFLSGLFDKEFISRETKCECIGDEYCEFVFEIRK